MKKIQWWVEITTPPKTLRYCKKCSAKTEYLSSGLFRINANKKNLDVWLVYRCHKCKTTWNSTILSRVAAKSIGSALLEKFQNNNPELALSYAMDTDVLKRNGCETEPHTYKIIGPDVNLEEYVQIEILCRYPTKIKLSKILRNKLGLSHKVFEEMINAGNICLVDDSIDIRKAKLQRSAIVAIYP